MTLAASTTVRFYPFIQITLFLKKYYIYIYIYIYTAMDIYIYIYIYTAMDK